MTKEGRPAARERLTSTEAKRGRGCQATQLHSYVLPSGVGDGRVFMLMTQVPQVLSHSHLLHKQQSPEGTIPTGMRPRFMND